MSHLYKLLKVRFRYVYMAFFTFVGLSLLFLLDPDVGFIQDLSYGAGFIATLSQIFKISLFVAILHLSRRALFDYVDLSTYFEKAFETSEGAGKALIAVGLAMVAVSIVVAVAIAL